MGATAVNLQDCYKNRASTRFNKWTRTDERREGGMVRRLRPRAGEKQILVFRPKRGGGERTAARASFLDITRPSFAAAAMRNDCSSTRVNVRESTGKKKN